MSCKKIFALTLFLIASMSVSGFAQENSNKVQADEIKTVATNEVIFETPKGYDDNDYQKLVTFLEAPSAIGSKNGYQLNYNYKPTNPNTWTGIEWTEDLEIKKVKSINMSGTYYTKLNLNGSLDLSGFSNLQKLNCSFTNISNLNLIGLFNLQELDCSYTEISSLDLTGLSNLQDLRCASNDIDNLDLTGLSNLQYLYCGGTEISSLDLTELSNLQYLACGSTNISSLDLTGLSNLQELYCYSTNISSLNLTGLSNLQTLDCGSTKISSLDLTGLSNLQVLDCGSTKISSLDLTGLSKLWNLDCDNTNISSLDLTRLSSLNYLKCQNCKLGINELRKIKVNYNNVFNNEFLNQNILDSYLYKKGDIKRFGGEESTYRWYIDGELIDLSTSAYDFSEYIGRKVKCKIIDRDIVLTSGEATIVDIDAEVKFDNPPKNIAKGSPTKFVASVEAKDTDMDIDKSVSWSVYDSTASTISVDGVLNVPFSETSETITVRATSNFDSTKYAEIELKVLSQTETDLLNAIAEGKEICNKDDATTGELIKAIVKISRSLKEFEENK